MRIKNPLSTQSKTGRGWGLFETGPIKNLNYSGMFLKVLQGIQSCSSVSALIYCICSSNIMNERWDQRVTSSIWLILKIFTSRNIFLQKISYNAYWGKIFSNVSLNWFHERKERKKNHKITRRMKNSNTTSEKILLQCEMQAKEGLYVGTSTNLYT